MRSKQKLSFATVTHIIGCQSFHHLRISNFRYYHVMFRVKITQNLRYIISKATSCTNCAVSEIKLCMYNFLVLSIAISFRFQESNRFPSMIYLLFCRKKNEYVWYIYTHWMAVTLNHKLSSWTLKSWNVSLRGARYFNFWLTCKNSNQMHTRGL